MQFIRMPRINRKTIKRCKKTTHRRHRRHRRSQRQRLSRRHRRYYKGGALNADAVETVNQQLVQRDNRHSNMLNLVCSDADNCLALGEYGVQIKAYFDQFTNFDLIDKSSARVLNAGNNGVVISLPYRRNGYTAHVALKCATSSDSDHLYYEYIVGTKFINLYLDKLPCFIETYKMYKFKNKTASNQCVELAMNHKNKIGFNFDFKNQLVPVDDGALMNADNINQSCVDGASMYCLLVQHFNRFIPASKLLEDKVNFRMYNMACMAFQVYFGLCSINRNFSWYTHYDLHTNNVFAYMPYKDPTKLIHFRYHINEKEVVKFNTPYVFKIIDYG